MPHQSVPKEMIFSTTSNRLSHSRSEGVHWHAHFQLSDKLAQKRTFSGTSSAADRLLISVASVFRIGLLFFFSSLPSARFSRSSSTASDASAAHKYLTYNFHISSSNLRGNSFIKISTFLFITNSLNFFLLIFSDNLPYVAH